MPFLDTGGTIDPNNLIASFNLCCMAMMKTTEGTSARYVPHLDNPGMPPGPGRGAWRPFDAWWTEPVIKDMQKRVFTRRGLVLGVANKEGGSHVDPSLPEPYADLSRNNSLGWLVGGSHEQGTGTPLGNPVPASLRQIAYEVDASVCREFPELAGTG
jgi:hypothetical protein